MGVQMGPITVALGSDVVRRRTPVHAVRRLRRDRRIGLTGGSEIQFAIDRLTGRMVVIEMNRGAVLLSACASKATRPSRSPRSPPGWWSGTPSTKSRNDITGRDTRQFEPTIDYVVTKVPRSASEKFPERSEILGTRTQSVGEAMAIGRNFPRVVAEGVALASNSSRRPQLRPGRSRLRGLPTTTSYPGVGGHAGPAVPSGGRTAPGGAGGTAPRRKRRKSLVPGPDKPYLPGEGAAASRWVGGGHAAAGLAAGQAARFLRRAAGPPVGTDSEAAVRAARTRCDVRATFKTVDTCAAEFDARTPYHYSTYEDTDEVRPATGQRS